MGFVKRAQQFEAIFLPRSDNRPCEEKQRESKIESMNRTVWGLFAILAVMTALALYYVWQGWQIVDLSTRVTATRVETENLIFQRNQLRIEVSKVWSLEEIERRARERLGMKKIQPKHLVLPAP
jgi:cell division protein FtsL